MHFPTAFVALVAGLTLVNALPAAPIPQGPPNTPEPQVDGKPGQPKIDDTILRPIFSHLEGTEPILNHEDDSPRPGVDRVFGAPKPGVVHLDTRPFKIHIEGSKDVQECGGDGHCPIMSVPIVARGNDDGKVKIDGEEKVWWARRRSVNKPEAPNTIYPKDT